jgi:hypothetical protein
MRKRLVGKWVAYRAAGMTINGCTVCGRNSFDKEGYLLRRIGYGWLLCRGGRHRDRQKPGQEAQGALCPLPTHLKRREPCS